MKRFSQACERNQEPILAVLRECFADRSKVLEIGSGTGQHAVHFAAGLPHLTWQPSDLQDSFASIEAWRAEAALANLRPPILLDLGRALSPSQAAALDGVDALFTANTLHIVAWPHVEALFALAADLLPADGVLAAYGPFAYGGRHTSQSNARFDLLLRDNDPASGIRAFEDVAALAAAHRFVLGADYAMPANNRTLIWRAVPR